MNLLISLRSEVLKTKRTAALYLTLFAAAFGPFMSLLDILIGEGVAASNRDTVFNMLLTEKFQMTGLAIFPIFLILLCTLLPQIEFKNNAWKQVLASPQHKGDIFFAKFINIHLLIAVFLLTNFLMMLLAAVVLHFKDPSLHVLQQPLNGYQILMTFLNSYIALLAICTIQFWLGLRFKNFIIPIAIGLCCWFAGTILVMGGQASFATYFPYSFHIYPNVPEFRSQMNAVHWASVGYAVAFLLIGYIDFTKRVRR